MPHDDENHEKTSPDHDPLSPWHDAISPLFANKKWIVAMDVLAGTLGVTRELERMGAEAALCVATSRGTGPIPESTPFMHAPVLLDLPPEPAPSQTTTPDVMGAIRSALDALANLPPEAVAAVDRFDPTRTARAIGAIFDDGRPVAGRHKLGARHLAWQAIEDKTIIDALWDEAGIERAPSQVVPCELDALLQAHRALDEGAGTVWAADARSGFHGGAALTRHVRHQADAEEICQDFQNIAENVRVMPFLTGVPCSIHGITLPHDTIALRPCEGLIFKHSTHNTFHYAASATFWDPPLLASEAMRQIARRTGDHLRERYDYRGTFSVDGVLTERGFLPTELNPRYGAALAWIDLASPTLSLFMLNLALIDGLPFEDWRADALERHLVHNAEVRRGGAAGMLVDRAPQEEQTRAMCFDGLTGQWRLVEDGEPSDATVVYGAARSGGYVRVRFDPERTPRGPRLAPRALTALRFASRELDFELPPMEML